MPLPAISGLYALASQKRRQSADLTAGADGRCSAVEAYEMTTKAKSLLLEAGNHDQHATSNENLVLNLEQLIHYLCASPHRSPYRTLALRCLEEASGLLRRENGSTVEEILSQTSLP
jgi:hypothetical protein